MPSFVDTLLNLMDERIRTEYVSASQISGPGKCYACRCKISEETVARKTIDSSDGTESFILHPVCDRVLSSNYMTERYKVWLLYFYCPTTFYFKN